MHKSVKRGGGGVNPKPPQRYTSDYSNFTRKKSILLPSGVAKIFVRKGRRSGPRNVLYSFTTPEKGSGGFSPGENFENCNAFSYILENFKSRIPRDNYFQLFCN